MSKDYIKANKEFKNPSGKKDKPKDEFYNEDNYKNKIFDGFGKDFTSLILNKQKDDYNSYIDKVKNYVRRIKDDISTSQLRNVFGEVKRAVEPKEIYLLRPKFAYISGRTDNNKQGMKEFLYLLDKLAKEVKTKEQLQEFKNFFESIISYHKYYGGKD